MAYDPTPNVHAFANVERQRSIALEYVNAASARQGVQNSWVNLVIYGVWIWSLYFEVQVQESALVRVHTFCTVNGLSLWLLHEFQHQLGS